MSQNPIHVDVRMNEALAQVAFLPAAVQGSMRTALFDVLSHHRLGVIKNAGTWPGKRRAQAMVASRMHRWSKASEADAGVTGQGFAAAVRGVKFGPDQFVREEQGQSISSSELMAIPVGAGRAMVESNIAGRRRQFRDLVKSRELMLIKTGAGRLLLVRLLKGRGRAQKGLRNQILAVLAKRRTEPGRLKFYPTWERVQAADAPKLERIIDLAATVAGRQKLAQREQRSGAGRAAFTATFREYLRAHPKHFAEARRAAKEAATLARGLVGGGA